MSHRFFKNNLLDLEAREDNEEYEEDEEGEEDGTFIDDNDYSYTQDICLWHEQWNVGSDIEDDIDWDAFYKRAYQRTHGTRYFRQYIMAESDGSLLSNNPLLMPSVDDKPIWSIKCWPGFEEEAVYTLFQLANNKTDILSAAFTRGPIRGYIFIEASLNKTLLDFIRRTPGIMKKHGEPILKFIQIEDRIGMLLLPKDQELRFTVGQWVQVSRGVYKNDIGYVRELKAWGGIQVILVPRIRFPASLSTRQQGKRSRTTPPPDQALFDPSRIEKEFNLSPIQKGTNTYFFNGCTYEHGLLIKDYDSYSISTSPVFISSDLHHLFLSSRHPIMLKAKFPPPLEWRFSLDELVDVVEGSHKRKLGRIKLILPEFFDVDLSSGEGLVRLPWHNVRKHFIIGDFVKVVAGVHEGKTGWIQNVTEPNISIVQRAGTTPVDNLPMMESFSVHPNSATIVPVPFEHSSPTNPLEDLIRSSTLTGTDHVPWKGVKVIIIKQGQQRKGEPAVVDNVLCNQDTASRLKVNVQFINYNPNMPLQKALFDYDDIVEFETKRELYEFQRPRNPIFHPLPRKLPFRPWISQLTTTTEGIENNSIGGSSSSIGGSSSSIPAKHHHTLMPAPLTKVQEPVTPQHILFSEKLWDTKIQVKVEGGQHKLAKVFVSSCMHEGKRKIIYAANRRTHALNPTWVTVIHPNIKQTDALLVVLEGEYAGRFGLRICHSRSHSEDTALVKIINRVKGSRPSETGIEMHFPANNLAIVFESKEEKNWNSECVQSRRKQARAP